jgi:hypothetical protein
MDVRNVSTEHWCNAGDKVKPMYTQSTVSLRTPQIPYGLAWDWTRSSSMGSRQLTTWTMARLGQMGSRRTWTFFLHACEIIPSIFKLDKWIVMPSITTLFAKLSKYSCDWRSYSSFKFICITYHKGMSHPNVLKLSYRSNVKKTPSQK